jgi:pyridoxine 5-phosphate synthase
MIKLGVNIDHVATVRQARGGKEPDPVALALAAESAGADGITVHLREDRRHIQERDVTILRQVVQTRLNLEMAAADEIVRLALAIKPDMCTLVPEKRQELTTEGGLNVVTQFDRIKPCVASLQAQGIKVSLFIDPDQAQIRAAVKSGADFIEIHTGRYADARDHLAAQQELTAIRNMAALAHGLQIGVNAGHGLNYRNVGPVAAIPEIVELNIGHSIISRALAVGLDAAVREMKRLMGEARLSCMENKK